MSNQAIAGLSIHKMLLSNNTPCGCCIPQRTAVYESLATTLAALHSVRPAAVGLEGYGRPSGYSRRQVLHDTKAVKGRARFDVSCALLC